MAPKKDDHAERMRRVRQRLALDPEALDALREICVRPQRGAYAQVAALRLRLEYSQERPAQEVRAKIDGGPLVVRFDLSGMTPTGAPKLPAGTPDSATPPGGAPGVEGGAAAASTPTDNSTPAIVFPGTPLIPESLPKGVRVRRRGVLPVRAEGKGAGQGDLPLTAEKGEEP